MANDAWSVRIGSGVWHIGDTFDVMRTLPSTSVDMILCDLPYGTTACNWDSVLPFDQLWAEYWRIAKPNAAIVLTASQPFTSALVMSQIANFKYSWIWNKVHHSNFMLAKYQPLKIHEDVCVFSKGRHSYNPIKTVGRPNHTANTRKTYKEDGFLGKRPPVVASNTTGLKNPKSIIEFEKHASQVGLHPTQKPVALFEYLIRTYTNPGDTVLDNTAGSGTTAVAAEQSGRRWICIERDEDYSMRAISRLSAVAL